MANDFTVDVEIKNKQALTFSVELSKAETISVENIVDTVGTNDHVKLINRDSDDQHPISAITGLQEELDKGIDHNQNTNRDLPNQHPISAITGLQKELDSKVDNYNYYTKDETYSKSEVYNKTETYSKDEVYNKTENYSKDEVYTKEETDTNIQEAVAPKQDIIEDLETIRSNASEGKTAKDTIDTYGDIVTHDVDEFMSVSTKYGADLSLTIDNTTYVVTAQLKDQDGNNLGTAKTIDLPLESVVVGGSYDKTTKEVVLTLNNGTTIKFSVADLVSGLQKEITETNKLSADLVDDSSTTNKFVTTTDKETWNGKQDTITDLDTIRSGAKLGATALQSYTETDPTVPNHVKNITSSNIETWNNKSDFSGDYNDLTNKPIIPSLDGYATETYVNEHHDSTKQDTLVSGTTIKTINNETLLGSGNITIEGGSGGTSDYDTLTNRPQINSVTLTGDKSLDDLGVQAKGNYAKTDTSNTFSSPQTIDDGSLTIKYSDTKTVIDNSYSGYDFIGTYLESSNRKPLMIGCCNFNTIKLDGSKAYMVTDVSTTANTNEIVTAKWVNDKGYTSNEGTITGITMNGASKGTSGVVDLGTVITEHQSLDGYAKTDDLGMMAFADKISNGDIDGTINQDKITDLATTFSGKQDVISDLETIRTNASEVVNKQDKLTEGDNIDITDNVISALSSASSSRPDNWTQTTLPTSAYWYSVCYGDGKFVAVAYNSSISAYSTDGINWTQITLPGSTYWESVCYGDGKFVAVAYNSISAYSTDGINWTQTTLPASTYWYSVCYGNGKFVAVANASSISAYSEDGINWTQTTLPGSTNWHSVCYGDGKFVAVAYNSSISAYSEDGINWTQISLPGSTNWRSVCYGDGKFVSVAYNSSISVCANSSVLNTNKIANCDLSNLSDDGEARVVNTRFDGQWIAITASAAHPLVNTSNTQSLTIDISSYIPSDGYNYEVMAQLNAYDNDSTYGYYLESDIFKPFTLSTTISLSLNQIYGGTYARQATNTLILPVKQYLYLYGAGADNIYVSLMGYRRIGTNT